MTSTHLPRAALGAALFLAVGLPFAVTAATPIHGQSEDAPGPTLPTKHLFTLAAQDPVGQFDNPSGMAVAGDGSVFVADTNNNRVQHFSATGQFLDSWGAEGTSDGQFLRPTGIAVAGDRVYVADRYNFRIQVFDLDGSYRAQWGERGTGNGQFDGPAALAVWHRGDAKHDQEAVRSPNGSRRNQATLRSADTSTSIFVADTGNSRIQEFDPDGHFLRAWGVQGRDPGQLDRPLGVAVVPAPSGAAGIAAGALVIVADTFNHRLQRFRTDGTFVDVVGGRGTGTGQFDGPVGLAVASDGGLFVADRLNHRIQRFDPAGRFVATWGQQGFGAGQFVAPWGVAVGPGANGADGTVYVADGGNGRVQRFDAKGGYWGQWGAYGSGEGQFNSPVGMSFAPDGTLYVADTGNNRVQHFTGGGVFIDTLGSYGSREGQLLSPVDVAVASDGSIYVSDAGNNRIQRFDPGGKVLARWGTPGSDAGQFNGPAGIAIGSDGAVYVADRLNHRIQRFGPAGELLGTWGTRGSGPGQFDRPEDVALGPDGTVYVADSFNHRIQRFSNSTPGSLLGTWGGYGAEDGQMVGPSGVAVAGDGTVYVADTFNHRVQRFDAGGAFLVRWGGAGSGDGQFDGPLGLAVAPDGAVYVADTGNDRLQRFSARGSFLGTWGTPGSTDGQFGSPGDVAIAPDGSFYVADSGHDRIQHFSALGELLGKWGSGGGAGGQFLAPGGIDVAADGTVYVADSGNDRVQRFDPGGLFLGLWGGTGVAEGEFRYPAGVAVWPDGAHAQAAGLVTPTVQDATTAVFVADRRNNRIQAFDPIGQFRAAWGAEGSGPDQMRLPESVAVAGDGTLYVADRRNSRMVHVTATGSTLGTWGTLGRGPGQFAWPTGVAVATDGLVYVTDSGFPDSGNNNRLEAFAADGRYMGQWGGAGFAAGQFNEPAGLAAGADGKLYVADLGNDRVQVFGKGYPTAWRAEYYANRWLAMRPVVVTQTAQVNFDWDKRAPDPRLPADGFSARFERAQFFPADAYRFTVQARGAVRLWVDEALVLERSNPSGAELADLPIVRMAAGTHRVRLEFADMGGPAEVLLAWEGTDRGEKVYLPLVRRRG